MDDRPPHLLAVAGPVSAAPDRDEYLERVITHHLECCEPCHDWAALHETDDYKWWLV